jgi:adenine-specific DNA-methyltransferase
LIKIKKILLSNDFFSYVSLLGKYKSGGYYTFSSKDLEIFLKYKVSNKKGDFKNAER